jgi:integrase
MPKYRTQTGHGIKLPTPERGNRITYDDVIKGFGIRVTAAGARSFILNYTIHGVERRLTIGSFPPWRTTEAREEAGRLRQDIDRGNDPISERRERRAAPTVAELIERYREEHLPRKRERSRIEDESLLRQWIIPELSTMRVADIRRVDIERLHRKITAKGTPVRANRMLILASRLFTLAVRWEMRTDNPVSAVERNHEEPRHRYLKGDEIQRLLDSLAKLRNRQAVTGARRSEVLSAQWSQFDLDAGVWVKPSTNTKQRRIHRIPLSAPARELLIEMKPVAGRSPYLFPSRSKAGHLEEIEASWCTVCRMAGITDVHIHDLRHSFAALVASSGGSLPLIGALLGHSQAQTTQRYAHLIDDALRQATEHVGRTVTRRNG